MLLKDKYKQRTATGELVPVKGTSNISFEIGGKPFVQEFLVASITDKRTVGLDFMRQHEISLNMKLFNKEQQKFFCITEALLNLCRV